MSITKNITAQVKETIKKYNMFEKGDRVIIGVSGGADSVTLLHILNSIKDDYNLHLIVAHVNHKIRIGDAERDAQFVENLCYNMDIEYHLCEVDVKSLAKEQNMSDEEAGRFARYNFFYSLCNTKNSKIATAHNANDNVETVLMRFMRGTSVKGLSGISYKRDNIVRPLLDVSRKDIEEYIKENNLTHITDSTNFENIYTRNKIRNELIPFMVDIFNPNLVETVGMNIQSYKEDSDFLDSCASTVFNKICKWNSDNKDYLNCSLDGLKTENVSISKRVIIKAIKTVMGKEQISITPKKIDEIYKGLNSEVGTIFVLNEGYEVLVDYEYLVFKPVSIDKNEFEYEIDLNKITSHTFVDISEFNLKLSIKPVQATEIENNGVEIYLPYQYFKNSKLKFRTIREGDIYRKSDNCHKKMNRVFSDRKISKVDRENCVLLCNNNEVVWCLSNFATHFNDRSGNFIKIRIENSEG